MEGVWNVSKNGIMIAPKREHSTSDVVQLACVKSVSGDGNVRSIVYHVNPDYRVNASRKDSRFEPRHKSGRESRQAFHCKFLDIVFIIEFNVKIKCQLLYLFMRKNMTLSVSKIKIIFATLTFF